MPKQDKVIRLLLVEDSADDAEQLVSQLRNAGLAVRPTRAETRDAVAEALGGQDLDLVLANPAARQVPLAEVCAAVQKLGKDRAVIALLPDANEVGLLQVFRDGARAAALRARPEHLLAIVRREFDDINHRRAVRRLEAALKESERRCDALLDSSRDPIAFVHEGMHVRANRAYLEMFGFGDFEEIEGTPMLDMIAPAAAESFKNLLKRLSKGEKPPTRLEIKAKKSDATVFDAVMEFAEATFEGEPCQQITFRLNLGTQAQASPDHDLVTGLYTRAHLLKELDRTVSEAASGKTDHSLLLIEPADFKRVLDEIGLGSADLLLADMAALLREHCTADDLAARLSETTFTVLYRRRSHEDAERAARALIRAFGERIFEAGGKSLQVPVSGGLVLVGERIANADAILGHAAAALKLARQSGNPNEVSIFDPAARDKADAAVERERLAQIKIALAQNGFVLFYQPIVSLHGAEGEYYEILLRMASAKGELLPAEFFPVAEKHGLLPALDKWVIAHAIKALAERAKSGHQTTLFVKLTVAGIEDSTLLPWIAQQLKAHRVSGERLVFEMPESKVTTNLRPVREFLRGLAQLHCSFAVQQFGSGLNSFQLLKHIDARYLKIDRPFMADLPKSKENQQKIKEICDQAHGNGRLTIAEFVEDAASMSILFGFGVNFVQGNFLQEPEKVMAYDFGS
jgi:diguanylate cyclase (GGDEF)-like protein/PAS domain S-box-containing protein